MYNLKYLQSFPDNATDMEYYNWKYKRPGNGGTEHKFKIYYKSSKKSSYGWNYPFIDFIYYGENSTHVWKIWGKKMAVPKFTFWPLQPRPLGRLWIPGPRDADYWLKTEYKEFHCKNHKYNHQTDKFRKIKQLNCLDVIGHYPFVWHEPVEDGMLEILKLNGTVIQSVVLPYTLGSVPPFGIEQQSAVTGKRQKT